MRNTIKYIALTVITLLLTSAINIFAEEVTEAPDLQPLGVQMIELEGSALTEFSDYKENEVLVKVKNIDGYNQVLGINNPMQLFSVNENEIENFDDIIVVDIEGSDMSSVLEEFRSSEDIEYAQPNYKVLTSSIDEKLWAIQNVGQTVDTSTGIDGIDLKLLDAWDITKGSGDLVIGVVDTGIDISHQTLSDSIWINEAEIPDNGIDDDGNGYIDDVNGWDFINGDKTVYDSATDDEHGTHVAGIISGNLGVAPNVKILPLKAFEGNSGYTSDIIDAIRYAENLGVKIINCSFASDEYNYALASVIGESDMFFVCAAGNYGRSTQELFSFPACYPFDNVISVSSIDNKGVLSPFSTYGKHIDISAPGSGIYSTLPGDNYGFKSGTSCSAAYVTGAAALLVSENPDLSAKQIKESLIAGATTSVISPEETIEPENLLNVYDVLEYDCPLEDENFVAGEYELLDISEFENQRKYPFDFTYSSGDVNLSIYNEEQYDSLSIKVSDSEENEVFSVEDFNENDNFVITNLDPDEVYPFSIVFVVDNIKICYLGSLMLFYDEESNLVLDVYDIMKQEYVIPNEDEEQGDFSLMAAGLITETADFGNTFSNAQPIYDDYDIYARLNPSGDVDWYRITFNTDGAVNFYLSSIPSGCNYKFQLYNSSNQLITTSESSNEHQKIPNYSLSAGTYYIRVYSPNNSYSSLQYFFRAKWYPAIIGNEPNNSSSAATSIGRISVTNGNINNPEDMDYFKFTINENSFVNINLERPSGSDYFMRVFRGVGDTNEITNSSIITLFGQDFSSNLTSGTYYVKIYSASGGYSANKYTLTINSGPMTNLTFNSTSSQTSVETNSIKYYQFSSNSSFGINFRLTGIGTSRFKLSLYKLIDNTAYALEYSATNTMSHSLTNGSYILGITKIDGTNSNYSVVNKYSNIALRCDNEITDTNLTMYSGDKHAVEVGFTNTGYNVWSYNNYYMCALNDGSSFTSYMHYLPSGKTYEYGESVYFLINIQAPKVTATSSKSIKWSMTQALSPFDWSVTQNITVLPKDDILSINQPETISGD